MKKVNLFKKSIRSKENPTFENDQGENVYVTPRPTKKLPKNDDGNESDSSFKSNEQDYINFDIEDPSDINRTTIKNSKITTSVPVPSIKDPKHAAVPDVPETKGSEVTSPGNKTDLKKLRFRSTDDVNIETPLKNTSANNTNDMHIYSDIIGDETGTSRPIEAFIIEIIGKKGTVFEKIEKRLKLNRGTINIVAYIIIHIITLSYFAYATYHFVNEENSNSTIICNTNGTSCNTNNTFDGTSRGRCYGACGFQWCDGYGMLLIIYVLCYFGIIYSVYLKSYVNIIFKEYASGKNIFKRTLEKRYFKIIPIAVLIIGIVIFLYFETRGSEERLMSLIGPGIFIFLGYVFSANRNEIKWKTVSIGILCQFGLGLFCIRWEIGRQIFQCIGDKVSVFLPYSNEGGAFVYGSKAIQDQVFAFATLPVIFFFSCIISILYYYGVMQWIVAKIGWILQLLLDTTVCESVNSAGNIFLGMSESPLLIRPYIELLTKSEIHAIMVSGFATVSGTVFAAYMSFGAEPAHLITSTVMAAPAALAFAKLYYPEVEESKTRLDNIKLKKSEDSSVMDAATNGAQAATAIILGIIANLISFIALVALLNGLVNWLGYLIGLDYLTFEWIFSKLFIPLCWCLGVPVKDCDIIAQVIAKKTVINEFVAFQKLGEFQKAGKISSLRSVGIATFAICGFANPSSLGIFIGLLTSLCPAQRTNITSVALRSCIVGSIVCFVSAGFAGLLMDENILNSLAGNNTKT